MVVGQVRRGGKRGVEGGLPKERRVKQDGEGTVGRWQGHSRRSLSPYQGEDEKSRRRREDRELRWKGRVRTQEGFRDDRPLAAVGEWTGGNEEWNCH